MYLKGSKWTYSRRTRRSSPLRVILLVVAVGAMVYINQVVVPATPPLFVPTSTPTRAPESFVSEAESLQAQGKLSPAIQAYAQAVQADPKNPANFIALARLQAYIGNYDDALKNAENAVLLNENNSMAHAVRGWVLGFKQEWLLAEAALKRSIELDGNNAVAYAYYAEVLANQDQAGSGDLGTLDKAIAASKTAQTIAPDIMESHRARGIVLEITGNNAEAAQEFEAAVKLNPSIADLHLALGRNYRVLKQPDKAVEEFNRANALNPVDPLPELYISRTYAQVGEYAKAIQFAEQAVKDSPTDPYMWGNLGVMYARNRQYKDAIPALRMALRGGTTEEGKEVQGIALDSSTRVIEFYSNFGLALARTGDCNEALQVAQQMENNVSNDEVAVYNAGEMINICKQLAAGGTFTPTANETEAAGATTPQPPATVEAATTPTPAK